MLLQQLTQLLCTLWLRRHIRMQLLTDILRNIKVPTQRTFLNIINHFLHILIQCAQQLQYRGRIGCRPQGHIAILHRQAHQRIVTRSVVVNRHHTCRCCIMLLNNLWHITHQHTTHRTKHRTIRSITLQFLAYRGKQMPAKDAAAMANKVPYPHMRHLAIHILQILMRHRNPLWLRGCTRGGCIHIWLTRKQNILFALLMALHIRAQRLKAIIYRHILTIQSEEILRTCSRQDTIKMMLLAIYRIA